MQPPEACAEIRSPATDPPQLTHQLLYLANPALLLTEGASEDEQPPANDGEGLARSAAKTHARAALLMEASYFGLIGPGTMGLFLPKSSTTIGSVFGALLTKPRISSGTSSGFWNTGCSWFNWESSEV